MINTLNKTKSILNKFNITAKKKFGQNFLVDDNILNAIKKLGEVKDDELVIEIGPGLGNLTEYLKEYNLLLIEIDNDMISILEDRFSLSNQNNIKLINKDVLKIDLDKEISCIEKEKNIKFSNVKVIANLPYYITSPIIFKLLEESTKVKEIIAMVQEEVADRISSKEKNKMYGVITIMINYFGNSYKAIQVPPNCFIPAPNVTSAVIKIVKENNFKDVDYDTFKELVHKAFLNRRKKMLNSLFLNNFKNMSKIELDELFKKSSIDVNVRAEELSIDKFIKISNNVKFMVKNNLNNTL